MDPVTIKVSVGNREYPLKVSKDDELLIQNAVSLVNQRMRDYEKNYPGTDKFDHLAMCTIQIASELAGLKAKQISADEELSVLVSEIDKSISECLSENNVH
jgi:cell division protein ZapA